MPNDQSSDRERRLCAVIDSAEYRVGPFHVLIVERTNDSFKSVTGGRCNCDAWDEVTNPICRHVMASIHHRACGQSPDIVDGPVERVDAEEEA